VTDSDHRVAEILRAVAAIDLRGSAYWASLCADSARRIHIEGDGEIFTDAEAVTLEGERFSVFASFLINRDSDELEFGFGDIEHIKIAGRFLNGCPVIDAIERDNPIERWFPQPT
jgi:hypothetical protein